MYFFFEKDYQTRVKQMYFENFVIESIENELDNNRIKKYDEADYFDAVLFDGVPYVDSIPKKNIYLDIKYANNKNYIKTELERNQRMYNDKYVCIICFDDVEIIEKNYAILGFSYIEQLADRHPILWWNFLASIDENAKVVLSDNGKYLKMVSNVPGIGREIEAVMPNKKESIFSLSEMNINDFKNKIKVGTKKPAMIIGNGVSIPFGSDPWAKVTESIFDYLNPLYLDNLQSVKKAIGDSNYFTASMSKMTISPNKYNEALKLCIYRKYEDKMHSPNTLIRSIVKIKQKFIDMPLITYNYDSFLEDDFNLINNKSKMSTVYDAKTDNLSLEPKIKHVHGFCSNTSPANPKNIILTDEEYFNVYKGNSWVVNEQKNALENHICLYVGSSMSDLFQMSIINDIKKKNNANLNHKAIGPWFCYALVCLKNLSPKDISTINNYYIRKSIRLIFVDDYEKLPKQLDDLFN